MQETWVWSLLWENPMCQGAAKLGGHSCWSPRAPRPVLLNKRNHRDEKPVQQQRPSTAKNLKNIYIYMKKISSKPRSLGEQCQTRPCNSLPSVLDLKTERFPSSQKCLPFFILWYFLARRPSPQIQQSWGRIWGFLTNYSMVLTYTQRKGYVHWKFKILGKFWRWVESLTSFDTEPAHLGGRTQTIFPGSPCVWGLLAPACIPACVCVWVFKYQCWMTLESTWSETFSLMEFWQKRCSADSHSEVLLKYDFTLN